MADAGCHVTGIDIAKNAIDAANQSAKYSEVQNVKFEQMDFLNEWVEPEIFDFVLCNHVVEHIPNDIDFVKKIHFSTKPGGRLLLSVPSTYSSLYRIHKIITGKFTWDEEVGHLRRYNQTTIVDLVEKAGYEIEKIEFLDSILREWTILFKPLRWTLRIFSRKYICNFFNYADKILAHFLFPATICVHAKKNS